MAEAIVMPALGETSDELTVEQWLVAEGESVALGQALLSVATDKAELEVESAAEGILLKIVIGAGETVAVGTTLAYVGDDGDPIPD